MKTTTKTAAAKLEELRAQLAVEYKMMTLLMPVGGRKLSQAMARVDLLDARIDRLEA